MVSYDIIYDNILSYNTAGALPQPAQLAQVSPAPGKPARERGSPQTRKGRGLRTVGERGVDPRRGSALCDSFSTGCICAVAA